VGRETDGEGLGSADLLEWVASQVGGLEG